MTTTKAIPDYELARAEAKTLFDSLGLGRITISQPRPAVRDNNWPCIEYDITFTHPKGRHWTTQYWLGVGHVKIAKQRDYLGSCNLLRLDDREANLLMALQKNPHAAAKDKSIHASLAAKLAKAQNVAPVPFEVFAQCCNDGLSAQDQSLENWAGDFGYDADSRKAEKIYYECRAVWFEVVALAGEANVRKLAELAAQF